MRVFRALQHSWSGLCFAVNEESAFRQELILTLLLLPLALYLPVTTVERILMIGSLFLVLIIELLNSAIEATIDRISLENHDLSRRAKDFGSAAVILALLTCGLIWGMILFPWVRPWLAAI